MNILRPLLYFAISWSIGCSSHNSLHQAEELTQQKKYSEAIQAYELHIAERLNDKDRYDWENPYFYLLRVGDILLTNDQPSEALEVYLRAESQAVETTLISDRLRALARWYEAQNRLEDAFNILTKHRDRDPLLFDSMLDRIGRALTEKEDKQL